MQLGHTSPTPHSRPSRGLRRLLRGLLLVLALLWVWRYGPDTCRFAYALAWWSSAQPDSVAAAVPLGFPDTHTHKPAQQQARGGPRVPKRLHQTYKDAGVPQKWLGAQAACVELHKDWEYKLWTDADAEEVRARMRARMRASGGALARAARVHAVPLCPCALLPHTVDVSQA